MNPSDQEPAHDKQPEENFSSTLSDKAKNRTLSQDDGKENETGKEKLTIKESMTNSVKIDTSVKDSSKRQQTSFGNFFSVCLVGSIESGSFESVDDVYIKYSTVAGPDWILNTSSDVGLTQIARCSSREDKLYEFVWNQPIAIGYRSYNFYGWPQLVVSVYHFDTFGNDQVLGYGSVHLPISSRIPTTHQQSIKIYAPQSSTLLGQIVSWITGRSPELVDSNLFGRADCRSVLQMKTVGTVNISFNLITKDVITNGYRS